MHNNCSSVEASALDIERTAYLANKSRIPPASDPPASSYQLRRFFNSAAKPAVSLCAMMQEINNVASKLHGNNLKKAQMLFEDIPILQKWQSATRPSNEVRDAMMKLGSRWNVRRYKRRRKRQPAEVAKDLEARMHKSGNALLRRRAARAVTQNNCSFVEASAPNIARAAYVSYVL